MKLKDQIKVIFNCNIDKDISFPTCDKPPNKRDFRIKIETGCTHGILNPALCCYSMYSISQTVGSIKIFFWSLKYMPIPDNCRSFDSLNIPGWLVSCTN